MLVRADRICACAGVVRAPSRSSAATRRWRSEGQMLPCLSHVQQARPYRAETGREGPRWPRDRPAHHSGKSLARWRADLIADLGGEANVTTQMKHDRRPSREDQADPRLGRYLAAHAAL